MQITPINSVSADQEQNLNNSNTTAAVSDTLAAVSDAALSTGIQDVTNLSEQTTDNDDVMNSEPPFPEELPQESKPSMVRSSQTILIPVDCDTVEISDAAKALFRADAASSAEAPAAATDATPIPSKRVVQLSQYTKADLLHLLEQGNITRQEYEAELALRANAGA